MKMEYAAEILRGWPADGALERAEMIKQGVTLVNGDLVVMQPDGTVDKVADSATTRYAGLVIRGNGDSAASSLANGDYMSPQNAVTVTAATYNAGTGLVTCTAAGHGYATGNVVYINFTVASGTNPGPGNKTITVTDTSHFTFPASATFSFTSGTALLVSNVNNTGKALVLWGNYIVRTSRITATSVVPGNVVMATASGGVTYWEKSNGTTDPVMGVILRVNGAVTGGYDSTKKMFVGPQTASWVIATK
jgi:hypothetical protein